MGRITYEGLFCEIARCLETPGGSYCESGMCSQRKVWERLKEYEDMDELRQRDNHGEWIEADPHPRGMKFICSECAKTVYYPQPTRGRWREKRCGYTFCPYCLSDMRPEEKKEKDKWECEETRRNLR